MSVHIDEVMKIRATTNMRRGSTNTKVVPRELGNGRRMLERPSLNMTKGCHVTRVCNKAQGI